MNDKILKTSFVLFQKYEILLMNGIEHLSEHNSIQFCSQLVSHSFSSLKGEGLHLQILRRFLKWNLYLTDQKKNENIALRGIILYIDR